MKQIFKFIPIFLIYLLGKKFMASVFVFTDLSSLLISSLLTFLLELIGSFILLIVSGILLSIICKKRIEDGKSTYFLRFILIKGGTTAIVAYVIKYLSDFYEGFTFNGDLKVLLVTAFIIAFVTTHVEKDKKRNKNNNSNN